LCYLLKILNPTASPNLPYIYFIPSDTITIISGNPHLIFSYTNSTPLLVKYFSKNPKLYA
jgi:hypothetical protein